MSSSCNERRRAPATGGRRVASERVLRGSVPAATSVATERALSGSRPAVFFAASESARRRSRPAMCAPVGLVAFFLMAALLPAAVYAQCCSPGSPIGGQSYLGALEEGAYTFAANYSHGYSGAYYEGSRPTTSPFVESGRFDHLSTAFAYGLSDRITLGGEASYFIRKAQNYVSGIIPSSLAGRGLGDVALTFDYNLYRSTPRRWEITSGFGFKVPLGTHRRRSEGAVLPLDVQTTTGAFDVTHRLFLYRFFPMHRLRLFLNNRIEWRGRNPEGYRYDNLVTTSLFASRSAGLHWNAILQLRSEIRTRDERPAGKIPVTGSRKIFLTPQIGYAVGRSTTVSLLVDVPLYQHYNGSQLANTFRFGVSLVKRVVPNPLMDVGPVRPLFP